MTTGSSGAVLLRVLERARTAGFLGPGPVEDHVHHADAFVDALPAEARFLVDLGSGGGVPALPVLVECTGLRAVLVEAMQKRAVFLRWSLEQLELSDRVTVRCERAEVAAHVPELRGAADVVTARGFAAPGITAECAVGFLRPGGVLIVSEPPESRSRWPELGLRQLGLGAPLRVGGVAVLRFAGAPGDQAAFPRATRQLVKHPLF
jgi:16S rRNA (guanine527-N7)-methyltransferase